MGKRQLDEGHGEEIASREETETRFEQIRISLCLMPSADLQCSTALCEQPVGEASDMLTADHKVAPHFPPHKLLWTVWLGLSVSTEDIPEDPWALAEPRLMALPAPSQGLVTSPPHLPPVP